METGSLKLKQSEKNSFIFEVLFNNSLVGLFIGDGDSNLFDFGTIENKQYPTFRDYRMEQQEERLVLGGIVFAALRYANKVTIEFEYL